MTTDFPGKQLILLRHSGRKNFLGSWQQPPQQLHRQTQQTSGVGGGVLLCFQEDSAPPPAFCERVVPTADEEGGARGGWALAEQEVSGPAFWGG